MSIFRLISIIWICAWVFLAAQAQATQLFECGTYVAYGTLAPGHSLPNKQEVSAKLVLWEKSVSEQSLSLNLSAPQKIRIQEMGNKPFYGEFEIEIGERSKTPSSVTLNRFMPKSSYVVQTTGKKFQMIKPKACAPTGGKSS